MLALVLFPGAGGGVYPFHWIDFVAVLGVTALGVLVARRARGGAPLVAFFALWGLGSVVFFVVPSPLGDNWTRLSAFIFPVMLLTASLAGFQPRRLVVLALAVAFAYNFVPYALLVPSRLGNDTQQASFWRPAIRFLRQHDRQAGFRVEVVPTAEHWEAYWIPKAGFPLARGWYRQLDVVDNPALYANHLDAAGYRHWLRSDAVRYVLLSTTAPLDWDGGPQEARIVRSRGFRAEGRLPQPELDDLRAAARDAAPDRPGEPGRHLLRAHRDPRAGLRRRAATSARPLQPVPAAEGQRLRLAGAGQDDVPRPDAAPAVRAQRPRHPRRARPRALQRHGGATCGS